jgi:hypothetical protein
MLPDTAFAFEQPEPVALSSQCSPIVANFGERDDAHPHGALQNAGRREQELRSQPIENDAGDRADLIDGDH